MSNIIKVLGICLLLFSFSEPVNDQKVIVIDAGHGGKDSGAKTEFASEKDHTLSIAREIQELAEGSNVKIILTRNDDTLVSLEDRVKTINKVNADQVISLHINKSNSSADNGYEFYVSNKNEKFKESLTLATKLSKNLPDDIAFNKIARANFYLLRNIDKPATLVDLGYLSNQKDAVFITSEAGQEKIARSIWSALSK